MCYARKPPVAMVGVAITGLISKYLMEDVILVSVSLPCVGVTQISVERLG